MTGYEFGDILLVPFPSTDQSTTKKRPAVVVSSSAYNLERPDLILLAVTSQVRPGTGFGECPVGQSVIKITGCSLPRWSVSPLNVSFWYHILRVCPHCFTIICRPRTIPTQTHGFVRRR